MENATVVRNKESVLLTWHDPNFNSSCVSHYRIRYKQNFLSEDLNNSSWTEVDVGGPGSTNVTLTSAFMDQNPCLVYRFQIFVNGDEEGTEVELGRKRRTQENLGPVRSLNATVTSNSVTVVWISPGEEGCIDYYTVNLYDTEEEVRSEVVQEPMIIFDDLEHCVIYRVVVVAHDTEKGDGEPAERTFRTDPTFPSQVQDLVWESNSTTLPMPATFVHVKWEKPITGSRCVQYSKVKMWRKSDPMDVAFEDEVTDTKVTVTELDACEIYVIEVTPSINETIEGAKTVTVMEMNAREPIAPTPVQSTGASAFALNLMTKSQDSKTVCELRFVKFICTTVVEEEGGSQCTPEQAEKCKYNQVTPLFKSLLVLRN